MSLAHERLVVLGMKGTMMATRENVGAQEGVSGCRAPVPFEPVPSG